MYILYVHSSYVTGSSSGCLPLWKPITQEASAGVKESGLFADAGHWEDRGLMSQSPSSGEIEDSCHKNCLHLSGLAEVFVRREKGIEQRDQGQGLKNSLSADKHSPFQ